MRRRAVALVVALLATACETAPIVAPAGDTPWVTGLVGGRVQTSPEATPIDDGIVLMEGRVITAVGPRAEVAVPPGATIADCAGATVVAGFWNSHVHFTEPVWADAATAPAERLDGALRAMLTSYGIVRALDTGSLPTNTAALRRRIESGEIAGPAIMMASGSLVPEGGSPYYLLPARLPEATNPAMTTAIVETVLDRGADGIKLFTGSWASRRSIIVMPIEIVRAATDAAHRRGKFVIAHPSNSAGARAAIEGGVDILAHTFPSELDRRPWDRALPGMMREHGMALVPTLKLFPYELGKANVPPEIVRVVLGIAQEQLRAFVDVGGEVLFGTDVGYMTEYDPRDEYVSMEAAGLSYAQILASLTTGPARRFGAARAGRLTRGADADVVVANGAPERDIRALADVRYTIRAGRVIYRKT